MYASKRLSILLLSASALLIHNRVDAATITVVSTKKAPIEGALVIVYDAGTRSV